MGWGKFIGTAGLFGAYIRSKPASEDRSPPSKFIFICIVYTMGDIISFDKSNAYGGKVEEQVYRKENNVLLSNEFSMCLTIENMEIKDTKLLIGLADVYSENQNARIYINGRYLQDVRFSEDMIGDNVEVSIPKNMISDTIVIRMVFPGAVTPKMIGQEDEDERVLSIEVNSISLMAG